jgi:hypothetical protein
MNKHNQTKSSLESLSSPNQHLICSICAEYDPKQILLTCTQCSIRIHPFCYSIETSKQIRNWKCDLCSQIKNVSSIQCSLCFRAGGPMKPTENEHEYAHVTTYKTNKHRYKQQPTKQKSMKLKSN